MSWEAAKVSRVGTMESQLLEMGRVVCVRHLIPAGFDSAPLYRGLPDDMCPCEHWCFLVKGRLRYRFADHAAELTVRGGDAFAVRGGHLADVLEDAELIEFTVAEDYRRKSEHLARRVTENRATGEQIVFRRTAAETNGELLEMDDFWAKSDHRTPAHVHPSMEERWEVIAGRVIFRIDGVERTAAPGEIVVAPPGTAHEAWNAGDAPVQLRIQMRPALRWQEFVEQLFALDGEGEGDERAEARSDALAALMDEFSGEVARP